MGFENNQVPRSMLGKPLATFCHCAKPNISPVSSKCLDCGAWLTTEQRKQTPLLELKSPPFHRVNIKVTPNAPEGVIVAFDPARVREEMNKVSQTLSRTTLTIKLPEGVHPHSSSQYPHGPYEVDGLSGLQWLVDVPSVSWRLDGPVQLPEFPSKIRTIPTYIDGHPISLDMALEAARIANMPHPVSQGVFLGMRHLRVSMPPKGVIVGNRPEPDWVWMSVAETVSQRATCTRLQVGAVIVDSNGCIVSTGYNGAPRNQEHCSESGCLIEEETGRCKRCVHAEANAIMQAETHRRLDATLYLTHYPCPECCMMIANSGITQVVYHYNYGHSTTLQETAAEILEGSGVTLTPWNS